MQYDVQSKAADSITCVSRTPAPRRHHGQQPPEHDALDVPEGRGVDHPQRLQDDQVQAVGRNRHAVIDEHEGEAQQGFDENPTQSAQLFNQRGHSATSTLHNATENKAQVRGVWAESMNMRHELITL